MWTSTVKTRRNCVKLKTHKGTIKTRLLCYRPSIKQPLCGHSCTESTESTPWCHNRWMETNTCVKRQLCHGPTEVRRRKRSLQSDAPSQRTPQKDARWVKTWPSQRSWSITGLRNRDVYSGFTVHLSYIVTYIECHPFKYERKGVESDKKPRDSVIFKFVFKAALMAERLQENRVKKFTSKFDFLFTCGWIKVEFGLHSVTRWKC